MISKKQVYLGIDFGTCNIVISEYSEPKTFKSYSVASTAIYDNCKNKLFYSDTENNKYDFPLLKDAKRLIGRNYSQLDETERKTLGLIDDGNKILYFYSNEKHSYSISPSKLSSQVILNALKKYGDCHINCVMCVPAIYSQVRRNGIKQVFEKTEIEILDIITDTSATALYLAVNGKLKEGINAICDLGGGIFDISFISKNNHKLTVIDNGGDDHLGGEDILNELVDYVADKVNNKINIYEDICKYRKVVDECEHFIKFYQSEKTKTVKIEEGIEVDISQGVVNNILKKYCERLRAIINQTLKNCKLELANINSVVLVGGSGKNSIINATVNDIFKCKAITDLDFTVAEGASFYANVLNGKINEECKYSINDSTCSYEPIYGIDLGNINLCISFLENPGKPYEIKTIKDSILPSTVAFDRRKDEIYRNVRLNEIDLDKFSIVYNFKKYIGLRYEEIEDKDDFKYNVYGIKYQLNMPMYEVISNNKKELISPSTVASKLFGSIEEELQNYSKSEDRFPVIVSVPIEFGTMQRNEILKSAEENNLEVIQLINDSTAAALFYCYERNFDNCYIAVYDLSCSRFATSFIDVNNGILTVKDFEIHRSISGDSITKELTKHINDKLDCKSESLLPKVYIEAEKCKITFLDDNVNECRIDIDDNTSSTVFRADYVKIVQEIINQTIEIFNSFENRNKIKDKDVIALIMSQNTIKIDQYLKNKIITSSKTVICSEGCVSKGAVLFRKAMNETEIEHYEVEDILSNSIGIEINKIFCSHQMEFIIKKGETLPIRKEIDVDLHNGKRTLELYEGECRNTVKNKYIGSIDINIPLEKCKENKVSVLFDVDKNGILTVKYKIDEIETNLTINYHK